MAERKALIFWGGWDGHEPDLVAEIFHKQLVDHGFKVEVHNDLDCLTDGDKLKGLDLLVPIYTMSSITQQQLNPLLEAVKSGVGIGGCHGGMCDSFRNETEYQFMTGGQWVAHPGNDGVDYTVRITQPDHFITRGVVAEFPVKSEQYYMHVDPANQVLAVTRFPTVDGPHVANGEFDMPVVWTKFYGKGRVFYNSLGHHADIVEQPNPLRLCTRGFLWAAHAEDAARD